MPTPSTHTSTTRAQMLTITTLPCPAVVARRTTNVTGTDHAPRTTASPAPPLTSTSRFARGILVSSKKSQQNNTLLNKTLFSRHLLRTGVHGPRERHLSGHDARVSSFVHVPERPAEVVRQLPQAAAAQRPQMLWPGQRQLRTAPNHCHCVSVFGRPPVHRTAGR